MKTLIREIRLCLNCGAAASSRVFSHVPASPMVSVLVALHSPLVTSFNLRDRRILRYRLLLNICVSMKNLARVRKDLGLSNRLCSFFCSSEPW